MSKFLSRLNQQQQQAVSHESGPAVVLAGAGSGKTRVLTTRAAWLIDEQGVNPDQILLVTFTNKAAHEMNRRVAELTGYQLPHSGTFHGFCARILRLEGRAVGLGKDYLIYDSSDQAALVKQIFKDLDLNRKKYKPKMVKGLISKAKNELVSVDDYLQYADDDFKQTVGRVYKVYQHRLAQQNAVDFDDLLSKVVTLFEQNQSILNRYQQQLLHVLVDEYQDTNKAQYQLTRQLAEPQNNVYVVGDFSQSIYAWRGADYRNLFYLQQEFDDMAEYRLEQNYRSTQPILSAASELIANNTTHPVLDLWTEKSSGEKITVIETSSNEQEAAAVVREIKQLQPKFNYGDVAILYRTNAQSRAFEEAFIQAGIPYQLIGGYKFYERKEIKDVLAYLRLAVNPQDEVSRERLKKVGKRRLRRFQKWLKEQEEEGADLSNPYQLLTGILESSRYLEKYDQADPDDRDRLENVQELLNVAAQFQDAIVFLENVSLVQDNEFKDITTQEKENQVTLMSLHSAKGLEFPVVFIAGVEEGLLPHSHSLFDPEKIEEERRLCYVGITRAKQKLYLTFTNTRWMYGRSKQTTRSRFLSQIPDKLITKRQYVDLPQGGRRHSSARSSKKYKSSAKSHRKSNKKYRIGIEIDEDELDALLNDEIEIEDFLNQ